MHSLHLARLGLSGTGSSQLLKRPSSSQQSRNLFTYDLEEPAFDLPEGLRAAATAAATVSPETWAPPSGDSAITSSSTGSAKFLHDLCKEAAATLPISAFETNGTELESQVPRGRQTGNMRLV